jgi:hypothetical protein
MPAIIEVTERVRLADLTRRKDKYMNLDKLKDLPSQQDYASNPESAKSQIYAIT